MNLTLIASSLFVLQANASLWNSTIGSLSRVFTSQIEQTVADLEPVHEDDFSMLMLEGSGASPSRSRVNSLESKSFEKDITEDILRYNEENGLHLSPSEFDIEATSIAVGNFIHYTKKGTIFYITPEEKEIPVAPFYPDVPDSMSVPAAQRLTGLYGADKENLVAAVMAKLRQ